MDIQNVLKANNKILICGKEFSGKTHFVKQFVSQLSESENILVLSNHKDIKGGAINPDNIEYLYKPKDCSNVDLKFLKTSANYIFIDENCENIAEISNKIKNKHLVFVKTVDKLSVEDLEFYDAIIKVNRDSKNQPYLEEVITQGSLFNI